MTKEDIQQALSKPLPGEKSWKKLTHSNRFNFSNNEPARENAVLILLYYKNEQLHCIYTKRTSHLKDKHSGQISFPGGGREKQDANFEETAMRECWEEIGLQIKQSDIIGKLTDFYIPVSNNNIKPIVAFLDDRPLNFKLQESEVVEVIEVPLNFFTDKENIKEKSFDFKGEMISIPYFDFNGQHIWGATAMMTMELLDALYHE